jgi:RNA polymerase sigma-70 factor, ECF subfamily
MQSVSRHPEELLTAARQGAPERLGELLQLYTNYLKVLAATHLDGRLQVRCSASDVVQETFLEAHRDFPQFRGDGEMEFLAWLRRILVNNLMRAVERHVVAQRRCVHREVSLEEMGASLERSTMRLEAVLAQHDPSTGSAVQRNERAIMLADELSAMGDDYRQVLLLRHIQGLSFKEVADRMERSPGAVRMLWMRAIGALRSRLEQRGAL